MSGWLPLKKKLILEPGLICHGFASKLVQSLACVACTFDYCNFKT
jgi:hypothetical protein